MIKLSLHIDELVLHGFDAADRHAIADAVRAEIARRLGETAPAEIWRRGAAIDRIAAPDVPLPAAPRGAGAAIAAAVHRGLVDAARGEGK